MNLQVTSVSKKEQMLAKTGASVSVITQEDIHRSGATNIPDLLRLVPGVEVAQIDANRWTVTIRGFANIYANKVLVLIDGRSIYTNVGSNVFWDDNTVPLEQIDRIEVIRGPGGTVWGANAVNGVINIITKNSKATQGGLVTAGGGSRQTEGLVQYGGTVGQAGTYRAFGQYSNIDNSVAPGGQKAADGWHSSQGGFRSDWDLSSHDTLTVEGSAMETAGGQTVTAVFANALPLQATIDDRQINTAGNVLGHWVHTFDNGSGTSLQISSDYEHRRSQFEVDAVREMTDVDFNYHLSLGSRNDVVWGLGYRFENDDLRPGLAVQILPLHSSDNLFSSFFQDEIRLAGPLTLTVGSKLEHNAFTGLEYEPSVQLVWTPSENHTLWASAARAVRQPSLVDFGLQNDLSIVALPNGSFAIPTLFGNPKTRNEELRDYEAGYRTSLSKHVSLDVTGFWSFYLGVVTREPGIPFLATSPGPPHLVLPLVWANEGHAFDSGAEFSATWDATSRWRLRSGYSFLNMSVAGDPSSHDTTIAGTGGDSPKHQFQVSSWWKVHKNVDWDTTLMFVSDLPTLHVPAYTRLDTRIGWRIGEFVELSVAGQNLLRPGHMEFYDPALHATDVQRSVFGKITWRF